MLYFGVFTSAIAASNTEKRETNAAKKLPVAQYCTYSIVHSKYLSYKYKTKFLTVLCRLHLE